MAHFDRSLNISKDYAANLYGIKYAVNETRTHIFYGNEWLIFVEEDGYLRIMVDGAIVDFELEYIGLDYCCCPDFGYYEIAGTKLCNRCNRKIKK